MFHVFLAAVHIESAALFHLIQSASAESLVRPGDFCVSLFRCVCMWWSKRSATTLGTARLLTARRRGTSGRTWKTTAVRRRYVSAVKSSRLHYIDLIILQLHPWNKLLLTFCYRGLHPHFQTCDLFCFLGSQCETCSRCTNCGCSSPIRVDAPTPRLWPRPQKTSRSPFRQIIQNLW